MRLPRNVNGLQLARGLERFGYELVSQRGSHIKLVTQRHGEHHVIVPEHRPIKPGTLNHLLKSVADHHGMTRDELVSKLEL